VVLESTCVFKKEKVKKKAEKKTILRSFLEEKQVMQVLVSLLNGPFQFYLYVHFTKIV